MHFNWRTVEEWRDMNVPLSTPSNEACKMFDAALTQYITWRDQDSVGGIRGALDKMMAADPNFVMGHVIKNGLDLMGVSHSIRKDGDFQAAVDHMVQMASVQTGLSDSEKKHVSAVKLFSEGRMGSAARVWEEILVDHPLDALALKFAHYGHFYRGKTDQMRDNIARVLPHYKPSNPYYGYLLSMYAFGLEETNIYDQAEKVARQGLAMNPDDPWAVHTVCHVLEMTGRQDEGLQFLDQTVKDWESSRMLACHNYWHWALYYIEKGEYEAAMEILDSQVKARACKSGSLHDIVDVCSLLLRVQMEGVDVGDRWQEVFEAISPHLDDHILVFNDVHILMACVGAGKHDVAKRMMDSIENFIKEAEGDTGEVMRAVGHNMCKAFMAYKDGDFAQAVDLLHPVRYRIIDIGWSHAQRDVFNLFLIQAAIKSSKVEHHRLARLLLAERKALKDNAPMTDRLMAKAMALHAD